MTTLKQMAARSLDGHHKVLSAVAAGVPAGGPTLRVSEMRGLRTCYATLTKWECVVTRKLDGVGEYETTLTETGRALLEILDERWGVRRVVK